MMVFFPNKPKRLKLGFDEIVIWADIISSKVVLENRIDDGICDIWGVNINEAK